MGGVNPISYSEMESFFSLHQLYPAPFEIDMINTFDMVALEEIGKQQEKVAKAKTPKKK